MFNYPYMNMAKPSLFGRASTLAKGINWSGLLDGTQKTLGVINQAIPVVYQVKPIISNAKTMFKLASAVKSDSNDEVNYTTSVSEKENSTKSDYENKPIFYI